MKKHLLLLPFLMITLLVIPAQAQNDDTAQTIDREELEGLPGYLLVNEVYAENSRPVIYDWRENMRHDTLFRGLFEGWQSDGAAFVFRTSLGAEEDTLDYYRYDLETQSSQHLTDNPFYFDLNKSDCTYQTRLSPDETQVLYTEQCETGSYRDIFIYDIPTDTHQQLTDTPEIDESEVQWSPDGSQLVFAAYRDGDSDIFMLNTDSGEVTNLTQQDSYDISPAWSPDGAYIAFISNRGTRSGIWIMEADGSRPTLLHEGEEQTMTFSGLNWQPETFDMQRNGNADVDEVRAVHRDDGTWTFYVTVSHPDTGWEDYADGWDVVLPTGVVLKPDEDSPFTRLLLHPHVEEQPFTRSQSGIEIPELQGQRSFVQVRAHDLVDGFGGQTVTVYLNLPEGENFTVER